MPQNPSPSLLRVFLCHASDDKPSVRSLYRALQTVEGMDPWLDEDKLVPGQVWDLEVRRALQRSEAIIVCLSKVAVSKESYVQKEIALAIELADEKPEGVVYLIPIKFEPCSVPDRLQRLQWINIADEGGFDKLMAALKMRADQLNIKVGKVSAPERQLRHTHSPGKTLGNRKGRVVPLSRETFNAATLGYEPGKRAFPQLSIGSMNATIFCDVPVAPMSVRFAAGMIDSICICLLLAGLFEILNAGSARVSFKLLIILTAVFTTVIYYVVWACSSRGTPGFRALSLDLISFEGHTLNRKTRLFRTAAFLVSLASGGIGLLWGVFDEESLVWHDHVSKTFPIAKHLARAE